VGGPARHWITAQTRDELISAVSQCDARRERVLLLGGGSNLVISDDGFDGTVIQIATRGISAADEGCAGGWLEVEAGHSWDDLVQWCIAQQWRGMEALSGIPGCVGATPLQNVGAYGYEVASMIARVTVWDRQSGQLRVMAAGDCGFSYRHSIFKSQPDRFVIVSVVFQLRRGDLSEPVRYAELADALGISVGQCAPSIQVRDAVMSLRRRKGMVLEAVDHDTWSVGSFFVNPIIAPGEVPQGAPVWPQPDGRVKTSAAWLVEKAGFPRGFALAGSDAAVSSKHSLALTNRGGATADQIMELAEVIRAGVATTFGIDLRIEPTVIGFAQA
jgi:UDP-N-acetylmuramate dehydrogenase